MRAASNRVRQAARRLERKLAGRCTQCAVDLTDDEGVLCDVCAQAKAESNRPYWRAASTRKRRNERQRRVRAARTAANLCIRCPKPTNGARSLCDSCAADQAQRDARRRAMRKQGIVPIASARPRPPKYIPLDELLETPRIRLLRAIRMLGWSLSSNLMEHLGVPSCTEDVRTHDVYSQHLVRLVKGGFVERRGLPPNSEYRITAAGRAELESVYALEKSA